MKVVAISCAKSAAKSASVPGNSVKPKVLLIGISDITETTFRVSASIDPYPIASVVLQYGKTEALGSEISLGQVKGHTILDQVIEPDPLILQPGDAFYCRLKVTNIAGSSYSDVTEGTLLNVLPSYSTALFWLDGTVVTVGENKYFKDKKGSRNFLITGYDFTGNGFPYKSAATISAPADDATLIAADVNSFLYTAGVPNQIPVVSLFQDIDYEHKLFCKHSAQVVNANEIETSEPKVTDIALYSDALTTTELVKAQTYFNVPVEDVTTSVWLSPAGNDTTGDGSKALPYRTLSKIRTTTKATVYLKSGNYDMAATVNFTGNALSVIGCGLVSFALYTVVDGCYANRDLTFKHCIISGQSNSYGFYGYTGKSIAFDKCKLTKTDGSLFVYAQTGSVNNIFKNCILNMKALIGYQTTVTKLEITGCIGVCKISNATKVQTTLILNHNKFTGSSLQLKASVNGSIVNNSIVAANTLRALFITAADAANVTGLKCNYNQVSGSISSDYLIAFMGSTESGTNAINAIEFIGNSIKNNYVGVGTAHTVFIGGGIDHIIKYNYIECSNGYGIIVKSGGVHFTTTTPHIYYNVIKITGSTLFAVIGRGAYGVVVANNTVIDFLGTTVFMTDDDASALDNSMLCINNLVTLSNTTAYLSNGTNMTSRNNTINKKGFTLTNAIGEYDFEASINVSATGVPSAKIEHAEVIEGFEQGLASNYSIPNAITYLNQGVTWQNGAVLI